MREFRTKRPVRSLSGNPKSTKSYKDYRDELRKDFNGRCGYTDCSDQWWAGGFHIDHFAPQKPKLECAKKRAKFSEKACIYENLVYSCPQVNIAKRNDWVSDCPDTPVVDDKGYLDPCNEDFNEHFERTDYGEIVPKSQVAKYMCDKLKLKARRYSVYWQIEQLEIRMDLLNDFYTKNKGRLDKEAIQEILDSIFELRNEIKGYLEYLGRA